MRTTGQQHTLSSENVYLEALENAEEQGREPDETWNQPKICMVYGIHRGKDCLCMSERCHEHGCNQRETNPIWISLDGRLLRRKAGYLLS